jgi:HlyD family secretion protein
MKRAVVPILVVAVVLGGFAWTLKFLYDKSQAAPVVYETRTPEVRDIVKKTVATGALVPRKEVEIKPPVPGVIEKLHVEPGNYVEAGALLAKIRIIPDVVRVNEAESAVREAQLRFDNARRELQRNRALFAKQVISETSLGEFELAFELRKQELAAARSNLQLVREGTSGKRGQVSNEVRSTVEGMVLDVPVKEGSQVIDSNSFNPGTTVASIANMNDMIFEGQVDESEVGKLREGMRLVITIGALEGVTLKGTLEYISPKGVTTEGIIQFQIRASLDPQKDIFIRAGYSANADIVLDRRDQVLAIDEALLQFDDGEPYVEVEVGPQQFERRDVEVGLSDGLVVEVLSGIDKDVQIKKHQGQEGEKSRRGGGRRRGLR